MNKKKKRVAVFGLIIVILLGLFFRALWENKNLEINAFYITSEKLPEEFEGFRIAQVSDLHNAQFGDKNTHLLAILHVSSPDIIALTGDIFDSRGSDNERVMQFMGDAMEIAPCYYVTGNHEAYLDRDLYLSYEERMTNMGITILHDEEVLLERGDATISLIGLDDPTYARKNGGNGANGGNGGSGGNGANGSNGGNGGNGGNGRNGGVGTTMAPEEIRALSSNGNFTVALSHRPEYFPQYVEADLDLVLSGHTHGGQVRLPFVGALFAPNQGFLPTYDAGLFTEVNTSMIVSRGIGNSILRLRYNNQPEVVLAILAAN